MISKLLVTLVPRANGVMLFDGHNGLKCVAMALELATFWVFSPNGKRIASEESCSSLLMIL
jgi:hypothetical protein